MSPHWRQDRLKDEEGIVVASDQNHEWLLPWWWDHYRKHNDHPVAFVDFGLSPKAKHWCKERGEYIPLFIPDIFVREREEIDPLLLTQWEGIFGTQFWPKRNAWFKKPLACLQSPFHRSIWIDLDCEIRGSLQPLFACSSPSEIGLAKERRTYLMYNGGVVVFQHGLSVIEEWAKESFEKNHLFPGDQEVLTKIIEEKKIPITELPEKYNWSRTYEDNPEALIFHWHGLHGQSIIRHQIWCAQLDF